MSENPRVLILIVNWNNYADTRACLDSMALLAYDNYQIMVVDNGSTDGSSDLLGKEFPPIKTVDLDQNLGFAGGNNVGLEYALEEDYPFVLLLNNDTLIQDGDFLTKLVEAMDEDQEIGAAAPAIEETDGEVQLSILPYPFLGSTLQNSLGLYRPDHGKRQFVDSVAGCCVLIRREAIEDVGYLDSNYFMYGEETEWFYRMRKTGWKILFLPIKSVIHKGKASIKMLERKDFYIESRVNLIYTLVKHGQKVQAAATIPLMLVLLFFRSIRSLLSGGNDYPLSMQHDLWKTAVDKWRLANRTRDYLKLSRLD